MLSNLWRIGLESPAVTPCQLRLQEVESSMPTITSSQISLYKARNPQWSITVVTCYDSETGCPDCHIKYVKYFASRKEANEFLRECPDDFIVIEYGCN